MTTFGLGRPSPANATEAFDSSTPWIAASEGNLARLQSSLQALHLPITAADENGYTLLHAAASYKQLAIIQFLFSQQVNVHAMDNEGDGCLHYAGNAATARLLVEQGRANPQHRNAQSLTALEVKRDELQELIKEAEEDDVSQEDMEDLKGIVDYLKN